MPTPQGDLALLDDPVARRLLQSTIPARLAYTWHDGDKVALTIDSDTMPYKVLSVRGTVRTDTVDGIAPEYEAMIMRVLGDAWGTGLAGNDASDLPADGARLHQA